MTEELYDIGTSLADLVKVIDKAAHSLGELVELVEKALDLVGENPNFINQVQADTKTEID